MNLGLWLAVLFALIVIPPMTGLIGPVELTIWMLLLVIWLVLFIRARHKHRASST